MNFTPREAKLITKVTKHYEISTSIGESFALMTSLFTHDFSRLTYDFAHLKGITPHELTTNISRTVPKLRN